MAENSEYILEPLRDGADFTLYRGKDRGSQLSILAVAVASERPSPQSVRRLEHEYSLATELDAAWAAQPLELTRQHGRPVLILKDPGGEPLDRVIEQHHEQPFDLTRFLRIAIGSAEALGQAHRQGLIHKDIKPANVFVDDSGQVWLSGFGIASRLTRERPTPVPPEVIAGTLAYMAPEQTGRMNRSVDTRSDLYSLGVTLYQMLTGVLPFNAAEPLEWVHCHIARQPVPPVDRHTVPEPLSAIIMKLLAKNAEERYQTAAGLEADLRRCLTEWQGHERIDPFPLGTDDLSDRLLIPLTRWTRVLSSSASNDCPVRTAGRLPGIPQPSARRPCPRCRRVEGFCMNTSDRKLVESLFAGDGEMATRMRELDWSATPLGPVERWSQALRTRVRTVLDSAYATATLWGSDHTYQYNNAFCPLVGGWGPVTHDSNGSRFLCGGEQLSATHCSNSGFAAFRCRSGSGDVHDHFGLPQATNPEPSDTRMIGGRAA